MIDWKFWNRKQVKDGNKKETRQSIHGGYYEFDIMLRDMVDPNKEKSKMIERLNFRIDDWRIWIHIDALYIVILR